MYATEPCFFSMWWIVPILMMILCFFMMRGRRGSTLCGFGSRGSDRDPAKGADSAMDVLDRRYASGDIERDEYEEKKRILTGRAGSEQDSTIHSGGKSS